MDWNWETFFCILFSVSVLMIRTNVDYRGNYEGPRKDNSVDTDKFLVYK